MAPRHELAERPVTALGVISPPPIHVQTPTFDGSLALLFTFVKDRRIDLLEVPLFPICEAYFAYLIASDDPCLDEAGAALGALAYLLERKAWRLLPGDEAEPTVEEALELPPSTAHQYADAIEALRLWQEERARLFFRSPEAGPNPYELPYVLQNVQPQDLAASFERVLRRAQPEPFDALPRPPRSLAEQMSLVLRSITRAWTPMHALVPDPISRTDAVFWFLALLELMRIGQIVGRLREDEVEFSRP